MSDSYADRFGSAPWISQGSIRKAAAIDSLEKSTICGCFYCFKEFAFERIAERIDDNETALCPYCGVDAVLGFASPTADEQLLHEMHDRWSKPSLQLTPGYLRG